MSWIDKLFDSLEFYNDDKQILWEAFYNASLLDHQKESLITRINECDNYEDFGKILGVLLQHERDMVLEGGRYSQTDIKKHLNKLK